MERRRKTKKGCNGSTSICLKLASESKRRAKNGCHESTDQSNESVRLVGFSLLFDVEAKNLDMAH